MKMMKNVFVHYGVAAAVLGAALSVSVPAQAKSNFLIWPIYPVIENNENAAPVWLENVGDEASMVQVRLFKWTQSNGSDQYENQQEIIPSPPIVRIGAGEKQMIRLTKAMAAPQGKEVSYRIIIDELPVALDKKDDGSSVNFKMRYSLPLFVYGAGIGSGLSQATKKINEKNPNAKPVLNWSVVSADGKDYLETENTGAMNARISGFKVDNKDYKSMAGSNTFAYVLPGSKMRFSVDSAFKAALASNKSVYAITSQNSEPVLMNRK